MMTCCCCGKEGVIARCVECGLHVCESCSYSYNPFYEEDYRICEICENKEERKEIKKNWAQDNEVKRRERRSELRKKKYWEPENVAKRKAKKLKNDLSRVSKAN